MLAPWKKSYHKPRQHIQKQRHYFVNKGPYRQSYGFSRSHLWVWDSDHKEDWRLKKWCFWIVVLGRRLWRVPWIARRSNQSIVKEVNPEYSLERLMLKLKLQYMGHLRWRVDSLEKTLMLGKIEGRRRGQWRMNGWMASPTQWTYVWANFGRRWGQRSLACCSSWGCKESDTSEQLNNNRWLRDANAKAKISKVLQENRTNMSHIPR